jgi:hypothetical protein
VTVIVCNEASKPPAFTRIGGPSRQVRARAFLNRLALCELAEAFRAVPFQLFLAEVFTEPRS